MLPWLTHTRFLPDEKLVYEGQQFDNVRVALKDDPLIDDFIRACEEVFRVLNRGERANYHGRMVLRGADATAVHRRDALEAELAQYHFG